MVHRNVPQHPFSKPQAPSQGPVDVRVTSVSSLCRQGRERHTPSSEIIKGWAQLLPVQPSTARELRGRQGQCWAPSPWGPVGGGRPQPPVLGACSAAWITWPQGHEHCRVGPSQAGLPPWAQPPCPVAVVHPLSLSLQWGPGPRTDPRPAAHRASAPEAGQGCLPCRWPRWG